METNNERIDCLWEFFYKLRKKGKAERNSQTCNTINGKQSDFYFIAFTV